MSQGFPPNFSEAELNCNSGAHCPYPDRLRHLAWTLQTIRNHFGKPIRVNSGYRDPDYNKRIGGATRSQHVEARAADLTPSVFSEHELDRLKSVINELVASGKIPNGGIGSYNTFVHYDMRPSGPARWEG
jgi:uncharacterized protein YcbK (DUF882 family)|tara:strand:- start:84 stop:473 length:390 start_codon:yes stop_codon:yes gene_type:complete